ncbi:TDT family transporter [Rhizobium sp. Root1220]|uniref:TDT family transporter n=1 Tax=Rhizobium sp. Root1220 TaxID=1736432 RepID=UPI0006FF9EB7|nr:TDT family transporter [Rhizobium sp. Root1220]KQV66047.1 C4-dicarboxylate ABC transporter [Rhizobium sp. Root1220]
MTAFTDPYVQARRSGWRQRVLHFTPNWFATTMGTGIVAICLGQFAAIPLLWKAGEILWLANILLFGILSALYAAKWLLHPREALSALGHPVVSMFFGCIPMGLATLVNGTLIFGVPLFGEPAVGMAIQLWWIDAALAIIAGFVIPFAMFTRHDHSLEQMSAIWLLPIVASEVAAASGGLLVTHVAGAGPQMTVLFASYVLWACSVPLALGLLSVLFLRMALHKLPPAGMAATAFLALGPIGTGALGLILFAVNGRAVLEANGLGALANSMSGASLFGALLLWAYGLWWLGMALVVTARYLTDGLPFNLGWWAYTFPIGVYALATLRLAILVPVPAIGTFGDLLVIALVAIWLVVAARTALGALEGTLFSDPCLQA